MSVQITTAFVEQYRGNVEHLVQQKGSRLRDSVSVETVVGKNAFFEQVGSTAAQQRTSRHSDTPRMDTPHARRRVSLIDFDWADLIDDEARGRMLIAPQSHDAEAAASAMHRPRPFIGLGVEALVASRARSVKLQRCNAAKPQSRRAVNKK